MDIKTQLNEAMKDAMRSGDAVRMEIENRKEAIEDAKNAERDDLHDLLMYDQLCFLSVTLLFAAVMSPLLFFGRSIGCSLTSTSTTSMIVSIG